MALADPTRPEAPVPARRTARGTVVVSLALHVVVLAAVVVVPLFGRVTLPHPSDRSIASFVHVAAAPAVPPPPAMTSPTPAPTARSTATPTTPARAIAAIPLEAPNQLPGDEVPTFVPGAAPGSGVSGAALTGVDGGLPGAPPLVAPPPPVPPVRAPIRVGGDIRPPRKLRHVAPGYPAIAAHAAVTGTVVLEATISRSGIVTDVRVLRSVPLLDAAAVEAVRQWRYEPSRLNGEPVAVLLTVTVRFGQ